MGTSIVWVNGRGSVHDLVRYDLFCSGRTFPLGWGRRHGAVRRPFLAGALASAGPFIRTSTFRNGIVMTFVGTPEAVVAHWPCRIATDLSSAAIEAEFY